MSQKQLDEIWGVKDSMLAVKLLFKRDIPNSYALNIKQEMALVRRIEELEAENARLRKTLIRLRSRFMGLKLNRKGYCVLCSVEMKNSEGPHAPDCPFKLLEDSDE